MKIAVIGLGYVGLPLSFQFARNGVHVLGLDIDTAKVDALNQGKSYIRHILPEHVAELVSSGSFSASTDFSRINETSATIICVPTPLNKNREPDISYILDTGKTLWQVTEKLGQLKPRRIKTCVLLEKFARRVEKVQADYVGFSIPDLFVVGYGLDFAERYRNLPFIGVLRPELYRAPNEDG